MFLEVIYILKLCETTERSKNRTTFGITRISFWLSTNAWLIKNKAHEGIQSSCVWYSSLCRFACRCFWGIRFRHSSRPKGHTSLVRLQILLSSPCSEHDTRATNPELTASYKGDQFNTRRYWLWLLWYARANWYGSYAKPLQPWHS
jgi:hypothetical protein